MREYFFERVRPIVEKALREGNHGDWPLITLIRTFGAFKGESDMINPPMYGIPLGILTYGIIVGLIVGYLKSNKTST